MWAVHFIQFLNDFKVEEEKSFHAASLKSADGRSLADLTRPRFLRQSALLHTYKHLHARDKSHLFNLVEEARGEALYPSLL